MKKMLALLLLASCSPDPSTPQPPAEASKPDEGVAPPRPKVPVIAFEAPAGWIKEEPEFPNVRRAQYRVVDKQKQAQDALFVLTTTRGWGQDDFDRWSAQMGGAQPKIEKVDGKNPVTIVDLSGNYRSDFDPNPIENARMLIGVVDTPERPWFFKLVGPVETVTSWHAEFVAMVKSAAR